MMKALSSPDFRDISYEEMSRLFEAAQRQEILRAWRAFRAHDHVWTGPVAVVDGEKTATCSICGLDAISYDEIVNPDPEGDDA